MGFLKRLIPKNIAGILGVIGTIIPLVRELTMVTIRILAIFSSKAEAWIKPVGTMFDVVTSGYEKFKDFFLEEGE